MENPSTSAPKVLRLPIPTRALAIAGALALLVSPWTASAGSDNAPCITEFMARNFSTDVPNAEANTFDDWVEIHNPAGAAVNLDGWYLTDDSGVPFKWPFPSIEIPANDYLVVFASANAVPDSKGNLHTNFALSASGGYLALINPDLDVVSEFDANGSDYPAQPQDVSYGIREAAATGFMINPTPGQANDPAEYIQVADTKFSINRGIFSEPISVELTSATPDAKIRYTLDHTTPTEENGMDYSGPIQISDTTVLKVRAFKEGMVPTNTDTNTYVYPDKVALQEKPEDYPTRWGGESRPDYEVDPDIAQDELYKDRFLRGLRELPVVSVAMPVDDMFGTRGLYSRSTDRNLEMAGSAEYFRPDPENDGMNLEDGFEVDCGVKIQGGASRNVEASIKHAFSLRFREEYGQAWLEYPLFDAPEAVTRFNSIHLRAMYNNSWIHRDAGQRNRATMIRDQWMRDTLIEMGNPDAGHGHYCHLYLNGLYWGIYNIHERLENANYAEYFGIDDDDTVENVTPPEQPPTYREMRTAVRDRDWPEIVKRLDVANYIDYYLTEHFGHNDDLKTNGNWRAAGGGSSGSLWRFYCWDSERVLENVRATGSLAASSQDGPEFFNFLDDIPEFQILYGDRLQEHLRPGGPMTSGASLARWNKYVEMLDTAIVCESARWGDERAPSRPYTRDEHWVDAVEDVQKFFVEEEPHRTSYFRDRQMSSEWPQTDIKKFVPGPQFLAGGQPQHGGSLADGQPVTFHPDEGTVYYTLDGTDPRIPASVGDPEILLAERVPATAFIPTDGSLGDTWQQPNFDDGSWIGGETGVGYQYDDLTGIDIKAMQGENGSAFIRVPFAIADQAALDEIGSLTLNMKYEDGFVAFINGTQVASSNAPSPLEWNSLATASNSDANAKEFEEFEASAGVAALQVGANILAIQIMNNSIGSSDVLALPQLTYQSASSAGLSPNATLYSEPIQLDRSATIRARKFTGDGWSAVSSALFIAEPLAGPGDVVISEISYHPSNPSPEEFAAGLDIDPRYTLGKDDFEFAELYNPTNKAVNLFGMSFNDGISIAFDSYVLDAGARAVVVRDPAAMAIRFFGSNVPIIGTYRGSLANGGETLSLLAADGTVIVAMAYDDTTPWSEEADGGGQSLHLNDPADDPTTGLSWTGAQPTPGAGEGTSPGEDYDVWAQLHFGENAGTLGLANADPEGDGVENFVEFSLGMDPAARDSHRLPQVSLVDGDLTLTYTRGADAPGVTFQPQVSTDLNQWSDVADAKVGENVYRASVVVPNDGEVFLRLRVSQ